MPHEAQAKLLRVLTDGQVTRIGSTKPRQVDVRVLAATHRELNQLIRDRLFREDLYYRLSVIPISIPPLRERSDDIPILCQLFLQQASRDLKAPKHELGRDALDRLAKYSFPGNIRELRNLIERACILSRTSVIGPESFPIAEETAGTDLAQGEPAKKWLELLPESLDLREFLSDAEKTLIDRTLKETRGAQAETARRLGLSRSHLAYKLSKYGLKPALDD
jgi:DNA-binding NtrC family response regulator